MPSTLTVRQYATAHSIPIEHLLGPLSERRDASVDSDAEVEVAELDEIRELMNTVAVEDLVDARDKLADARADLRAAEQDLQRAVREALAEGMPAKRVGEVLGVSRARVYQLRDGKR
ncbi:MAG: hypothetical protein HOV78_11555 [Hamadaea sp.]|nr:hypothetical protein [Hamadaea sp.]